MKALQWVPQGRPGEEPWHWTLRVDGKERGGVFRAFSNKSTRLRLCWVGAVLGGPLDETEHGSVRDAARRVVSALTAGPR